ncbi:MAG TPA: HEAT repeat domain-containing protein [Planctomycetota bacterium]|nr:HEAT repeat domain-containing protein [Planctomycetota bacterium]
MKRLLLVFAATLASCGSGPSPDLASGDPYERYLGALEAASSADPAEHRKVEALLRDPDPLARIGAVVAISMSRRRDALGLLTPMLSDSDPGVRTEVIRAVAALKNPVSVAPLAALLSSDPAVEAKRTAAIALGSFPDGPEVRAALLAAMADREAGVAYNAYRSLIRVTGREDLPRARAQAEEALKRS